MLAVHGIVILKNKPYISKQQFVLQAMATESVFVEFMNFILESLYDYSRTKH